MNSAGWSRTARSSDSVSPTSPDAPISTVATASDRARVNGAGAALNGLDISGQVVIDAPNVTIANSRIAACGGSDDNDVVAVRYKASDATYKASNARIIHNNTK